MTIDYNKKDIFNKFVFQRKIHSTLKISGMHGKNKQVHVEIRKKRIYVQRILKDSQDYDMQSEQQEVIASVDGLVDKKIGGKLIETRKSDQLLVSTQHKLQKNFDLYVENDRRCNVIQENQLCDSIEKDSITLDFKKYIVKNDHDDLNIMLHKDIKIIKEDDYNKKKHEILTPLGVKQNDNNKKLDNGRRHRSRIRFRYRSGGSGRLVKQKRDNNCRLYDDAITHESDKEEGFDILSNKVDKNKRKQNTLVQNFNKPIKKITRDIIIGKKISVLELASKMAVKGSYVIKTMMQLGLVVTINQVVDQETAQLVAEELGHNVILRSENMLEEYIIRERNNNILTNDCSILKRRAPIVAVIGHVDHGKTSLIDYIRSTRIASREVGGITQRIGAYHVNTNNGTITFLDTPGHVAFTAMRIRGVQLTDIVVLVVAADDGVMPQTVEAIQHVKNANVPVVVAINKIDKVTSNLERIKNDLNNYGLVPEDWGGKTQYVGVSAITGDGIDDLLDSILLQAEILDLKVIQDGMGTAVVIESYVDKGLGPVVTVLVREGRLKCGDVILCGLIYGRIRSMRNEFGSDVVSAGPSIPVELLGLSGTPVSGELAMVVQDEKKAREVALYRQEKYRETQLARKQVSNIENILSSMKNLASTTIELHLIIKCDTQGSVEAIRESLLSLSTNQVIIKILSSSIGGITETDAVLASASHSIILGFNVRSDASARRIIEINGLDVRYYSVIYDLLNSVKKIISGMLVSDNHKPMGLAEVRSIFRSPKSGIIAGCLVIEGIVQRHKKLKIVRENVVIYEGLLGSLRRFKNDVYEVRSGTECGIGVKNYNDICINDIIEVFDDS